MGLFGTSESSDRFVFDQLIKVVTKQLLVLPKNKDNIQRQLTFTEGNKLSYLDYLFSNNPTVEQVEQILPYLDLRIFLIEFEIINNHIHDFKILALFLKKINECQYFRHNICRFHGLILSIYKKFPLECYEEINNNLPLLAYCLNSRGFFSTYIELKNIHLLTEKNIEQMIVQNSLFLSRVSESLCRFQFIKRMYDKYLVKYTSEWKQIWVYKNQPVLFFDKMFDLNNFEFDAYATSELMTELGKRRTLRIIDRYPSHKMIMIMINSSFDTEYKENVVRQYVTDVSEMEMMELFPLFPAVIYDKFRELFVSTFCDIVDDDYILKLGIERIIDLIYLTPNTLVFLRKIFDSKSVSAYSKKNIVQMYVHDLKHDISDEIFIELYNKNPAFIFDSFNESLTDSFLIESRLNLIIENTPTMSELGPSPSIKLLELSHSPVLFKKMISDVCFSDAFRKFIVWSFVDELRLTDSDIFDLYNKYPDLIFDLVKKNRMNLLVGNTKHNHLVKLGVKRIVELLDFSLSPNLLHTVLSTPFTSVVFQEFIMKLFFPKIDIDCNIIDVVYSQHADLVFDLLKETQFPIFMNYISDKIHRLYFNEERLTYLLNNSHSTKLLVDICNSSFTTDDFCKSIISKYLLKYLEVSKIEKCDLIILYEKYPVLIFDLLKDKCKAFLFRHITPYIISQFGEERILDVINIFTEFSSISDGGYEEVNILKWDVSMDGDEECCGKEYDDEDLIVDYRLNVFDIIIYDVIIHFNCYLFVLDTSIPFLLMNTASNINNELYVEICHAFCRRTSTLTSEYIEKLSKYFFNTSCFQAICENDMIPTDDILLLKDFMTLEQIPHNEIFNLSSLLKTHKNDERIVDHLFPILCGVDFLPYMNEDLLEIVFKKNGKKIPFSFQQIHKVLVNKDNNKIIISHKYSSGYNYYDINYNIAFKSSFMSFFNKNINAILDDSDFQPSRAFWRLYADDFSWDLVPLRYKLLDNDRLKEATRLSENQNKSISTNNFKSFPATDPLIWAFFKSYHKSPYVSKKEITYLYRKIMTSEGPRCEGLHCECARCAGPRRQNNRYNKKSNYNTTTKTLDFPDELKDNSTFYTKLILLSDFDVPSYYYEKVNADDAKELLNENSSIVKYLNPKILNVDHCQIIEAVDKTYLQFIPKVLYNTFMSQCKPIPIITEMYTDEYVKSQPSHPLSVATPIISQPSAPEINNITYISTELELTLPNVPSAPLIEAHPTLNSLYL